jgi:cyclopropane-fatty-acyl-phospholipid synthase
MFEKGVLPDFAARVAIRSQTRRSLRAYRGLTVEKRAAYLELLVRRLRRSPVAARPETANVQHYELPPEFFRRVLGARMKYSCCYWPAGTGDLDRAEEAMLSLTCERAGVEDGMSVLDLGCGWGSLALWIAERHPRCRVTAVSNSSLQGEFIRRERERRGLPGVEVVTADVNEFRAGRRFDRVVSVEMFEHVKNYEALMARIAGFLVPGGRLFVHVFCHAELAFEYLPRGPNRWMAEHFFTGGNMPSRDLLPRFQRDLVLERAWAVDGTHYARTLRAWRANLDANKTEIRALTAGIYGEERARLWVRRWRLFFIACEASFGLRRGTEYHVAHYLFEKRPLSEGQRQRAGPEGGPPRA